MNRRLLPSAFLLLCGGCAHHHPPAAAVTAPPAASQDDAELARFLDWFPGEYSNHEQALEHNAQEGVEPAMELHHLFVPVPALQLEGHAFFVQQRAAGSERPFRTRLYLVKQGDPGEIVLEIFKLADEQAWHDAHLEPARFAALSAEELIPTPGCEVTWRWDGEAFDGRVREGACTITSSRTGERLSIRDELRLTAESISIHDVAYREDGSVAFGDPEQPTLNRRLRY